MRMHNKFRGGRKSAVGNITLPSRASRHGKPLTEVFMKEAVIQVTRGTRVNAAGEVEMYVERKVISERRPMRPEEIEFARKNVLRALNPTTNYAIVNTGGLAKKPA